jgi:hypothetical protein
LTPLGVVKKIMSQQQFLDWQVWPALALGKETLNAGATPPKIANAAKPKLEVHL